MDLLNNLMFSLINAEHDTNEKSLSPSHFVSVPRCPTMPGLNNSNIDEGLFIRYLMLYRSE